jgi:hypothetical protein
MAPGIPTTLCTCCSLWSSRQWRGPGLLYSTSSQRQRPAWLRRTVNHALRPAAVTTTDGPDASQSAGQPTAHLQQLQEQEQEQQQQKQKQQQEQEQQEPQGDLQQWEQMRQQVLAFQQAHGWLPRQGANKLGKLVEGERRLGKWCTQQRRRQNGSKGPPLSGSQVAALEAIPGWRKQAAGTHRPYGPRVSWEQRRLEVVAFCAQHGRWPRERGSKALPLLPGEEELGRWCNTQRQRWKGNTSYGRPLTPEQAAALEAVHGWFWEERQREPWEARYQQVAAFLRQHGRFPRRIATKDKPFGEGEQELANWCSAQRQRWRGNIKPPLTPEQVAALEALPDWRWEERAEAWEQRRQQLAAFVQQHGRLPRSKGSQSRPPLEGEKELGTWLSHQRWLLRGHSAYAALSAEQLAALDASIPGWRG